MQGREAHIVLHSHEETVSHYAYIDEIPKPVLFDDVPDGVVPRQGYLGGAVILHPEERASCGRASRTHGDLCYIQETSRTHGDRGAFLGPAQVYYTGHGSHVCSDLHASNDASHDPWCLHDWILVVPDVHQPSPKVRVQPGSLLKLRDRMVGAVAWSWHR